MKISACWIVKNEEHNIARSIESVKPVVDEIIVVDTGSSDATVSVAQNAGAVTDYFEWTGDFSAAKNYALSKASGEIIVFLDADEWFVPALDEKLRKSIENRFIKDKKLESLQINIHNLNSQGKVRTVSIGNRIFLKKKNICFKKSIHEQLLHEDGSDIVSFNIEEPVIYHSGYTEDIMPVKMQRNIELLENAAKSSNDKLDRHLQSMYLVREYLQTKQYDDCYRHLRLVLDSPELIKRQCKLYQHGVAPLVYSAISAAHQMRSKVSRLEIKKKLVDTFKNTIPDYPGSKTITLYYRALFEQKEDVLLAEIEPALKAAKACPDSPISNYRIAESYIYFTAARACFRRGMHAKALDYAVESFKHNQNPNPIALKTLIYCLRGQAPEEIVLFLNSLFDIRRPLILEFLAEGTKVDGYQAVHAYYLGKKIEAEIATKGDFIYMLVLNGQYEEAADAAMDLHSGDEAAMRHDLLLIILCSLDAGIYDRYKDKLQGLEVLIESVLNGTSLPSVTESGIKLLWTLYDLVAFASGTERAARFLNAYHSQPVFCFQIKAKYCCDNGLYDIPANDVMPNPSDEVSRRFVLECLTHVKSYDLAFRMLEPVMAVAEEIEPFYLTLLCVIKDGANSPTDKIAKELYEKYRREYDKIIDERDAATTGYSA